MHKSNAGYEYWDSIKDEVVDKFNIPLIVITVITIIGLFYFIKG